MRVAILGGTGGVGRWLLAIARENGDRVKALVRDRSKLPDDLGAVGVVEGDALDPQAVATTIAGCDVVFSALGPGGIGATTLYSQSAALVIDAMRRDGVSRVLAISSAGAEDDPNMNAFARRIIMPFVLGRVLRDMAAMERAYVASGLPYTVVRPGRLTDGPRTGLYRANDRFVPERGREIARADVADFMYRAVADERAVRKIVALTY
ncbi:MAG: NAD(P)H-binding protein [Vulcanimicrobiaceae bacterium]